MSNLGRGHPLQGHLAHRVGRVVEHRSPAVGRGNLAAGPHTAGWGRGIPAVAEVGRGRCCGSDHNGPGRSDPVEERRSLAEGAVGMESARAGGTGSARRLVDDMLRL